MNWRQLANEIEQMVRNSLDFSKMAEDEEVVNYINQAIIERSRIDYISLQDKMKIHNYVFHALRGYDCLEEILEDEDITEIMINGYQKIFVEKGGHIYAWEHGFDSEEKYLDIIQHIVARCNRIVNSSCPIVDARLDDGSRVNVVLPPIALDGAVMTIRRFSRNTYSLEDLMHMNMLSKEMYEVLRIIVKSKYNIMISGGTGSGKTTFLNALANQIEADERVITIEDSAELQIVGIPNLVRMEVRNANIEGKNEIPISQLIRSSLRMRPDRILVGEVRGGEALDMLQAMNTGHQGSISTAHSNSARDMLLRLETMVLMGVDMPIAAIRQQIAAAVDIVIHIGRLPDGSRKVLEIAEILGIRDGSIYMQTLYQYSQDEWRRYYPIESRRQMEEMGYEKLYQAILDS